MTWPAVTAGSARLLQSINPAQPVCDVVPTRAVLVHQPQQYLPRQRELSLLLTRLLGSNPIGERIGRCRFDSSAAHRTFLSTLTPRQVLEKWRGCGGSIESISVERDSFRQKQQLQPLLVVERRLHPQV
jgi:hypothetical protein